ncbi:MAG: DUF4956 domain-containing protein [Lachnospiraceae bacterium]|nr:DUF4956 domain-containing protein [Lachnospiraceae bacterium]
MKEQLIDYLVSTTGALTIEDIILNFLVAAVIGGVIFLSYRLSHSNAVYSVRFNASLVMLTLVTSLVMCVIGNNVALSLGMVGALSIVRFRTPIKDSRDTAYIFWCIAVGICCGVSEYLIAAVGTGVIFLVMLIFGLIRNNDRYLIIIRGSDNAIGETGQVMDELFKKDAKLRVRNTSSNFEEYIYEVSERVLNRKKSDYDIVEFLHDRVKAESVNIVCQNDEIGR